MREAVIVDAVRTPLGRGKQTGALYPVHAVDLAAKALKALVERTGIDPALVEDVIMGCVRQVGEQGVNIGRNAALAAGFPETVCGTTVDRQCGSSQQALHFAAQGVIAGAYDIVIAAGVESMSRVPMGTSAAVGGQPFGPTMVQRYQPRRTVRRRRARAAGHLRRDHRRQVEALARRRSTSSRVGSHQKAAAATRNGWFDERDRARRDAKQPTAAATHHHRRGHPRRQLAREAGGAEARLQATTASSPPATRARSPTAPPRCW